jgi:hypothetical protein
MQVRGGDLFDFLADMRQEEVSEEQAKYMFAQLLAGAQFTTQFTCFTGTKI